MQSKASGSPSPSIIAASSSRISKNSACISGCLTDVILLILSEIITIGRSCGEGNSKMSMLQLKPAASCKYDLIALGEVMLRLDPGEGRVRTAREFKAWEGGGEYNVARGLRRCFGLKTAVCTAFAQNDVGGLLEDLILQGGVDTEFIKWVAYDGVGRTARNGLNFTERGFGVRGAVGISDRGNTTAR